MIKRGTAIAVIAAGALGAPDAQAQTVDDVRCTSDVTIRLSEGLRLGVPLQQGTLETVEPAVTTCSGTLDGRAFTAVAGTLTLDGTFGDGPVSDPLGDGSGGATCSHNDGYLGATLRFRALGGRVAIKVRDVYWLRSAMAVIKARGSSGGAALTAAGLISRRNGTCIDPAQPITEAGFRLDTTLVGDVPYRLKRARRGR